MRHEQQHLQSLGGHIEISQADISVRVRNTKEAVQAGTPVVYQPTLQVNTVFNGIDVEILGIPDFLIRDGNGYVIRDAKLSRSITEEARPEIILQVQLYGWLFEQVFGTPPKRLEVYSGKQEIALVPYDGGAAALKELETVLRLKQLGSEPYEPVGQSKCTGCGFENRCWSRAEEHQDVSLLVDVDQGLARQLHSEGITTPTELLSKFDAQALSELKRPRGGKRWCGCSKDFALRGGATLEHRASAFLSQCTYG
jgi:predicted RecB family nuclease